MKNIITDGLKTYDLDDYPPEALLWLTDRTPAEQETLFARVAAAYRAAHKNAEAIANMPFALVKEGSGADYDVSNAWENKVGFLADPSELFRLTALSIFWTNTAYLWRSKNQLGQTKALIHLVPTNITPRLNAAGELHDLERKVNNRIEHYSPDDSRIIRLWRLDHTTELLPSKNTDGLALMNAASVIYYHDFWVKNFFARGGVKPTIISIKGNLTPEKRKEEEQGWTKFIRNVSRFMARIINADAMSVEPLGEGVGDLKDSEVYKQAIENVAMASGMPLSLLLANSANYATATVEYRTWFRDVIIPRCNWIANRLYEPLFQPLGLRLDFRPEMTDPDQEEESKRALALSTFMDFLNKSPTAEIAKGTALTFGYELNQDLLTAIDDHFADKEKRAEEAAQQLQQLPNQVIPKQPENESPFEDKRWHPTFDQLKEHKRWREVTASRVARGESPVYDYIPKYGGVPDALWNEIKKGLAAEKAWTRQEVYAVFDNAMLQAEKQEVPSDIIVLAQSINRLAGVTT